MADISTTPPLVSGSISQAYLKIKPYIHQTPLLTSQSLDRIASHSNPRSYPNPGLAKSSPKFHLFFKCENFQKIGAFKARGAHHALIRLIDELGIEEVRKRGVVTHSSGNHAQALALAAHTFNVPSWIIMPRISTSSKITSTQSFTPNVILCGTAQEERERAVVEVIEKYNAIRIPSYDHPDIILGQGTVGLELEQQYQEIQGKDAYLDAVITPLGGGGLLSGTATWFSSDDRPKKTLLFGAEPSFQGANDAQRGLAQSPPSRVTSVNSFTIADGLRTHVGEYPWSVISDKSKVEGVYSVTEEEIKLALRLVLERVKVVVEPSAVVGLAVLLFSEEFREQVAKRQQEEGTGRAWDVAVVFSGGNTTVEALAELYGST